MSTIAQYTAAVRNLRLDQTWDQVNTGFLRLYSGTKPATADTALSGNTLLAELTFAPTAFAPSSSGTKTANAIGAAADAPATGVATFWRAFKSDGVTVVSQGDVGVTGSGNFIELPTTTINQHDQVSITSFAVSESA